MEKNIAVGRRKASIARVHIRSGKGNMTVNKKELKDYFPISFLQNKVVEPVKVAGLEGKFDFLINVKGGGIKGQAEAIALGIARALLLVEPEVRPELKKNRLLTRDPRTVERKKPGLRKARKREQFSKR